MHPCTPGNGEDGRRVTEQGQLIEQEMDGFMQPCHRGNDRVMGARDRRFRLLDRGVTHQLEIGCINSEVYLRICSRCTVWSCEIGWWHR